MINPADCLLMVVDIQGKLAQVMQQSSMLHHRVATLIEGAKLFDMPIIWLEQLPDKLGSTSEELAQLLSPVCQPIAKQHFSSWQSVQVQTTLAQQGRKQVILCGIETHVCVYQTCKDLLENDFDVHIVADAMSSRQLDNKVLGIQMMLNLGAQLTNVESLLFELQHQAQGDRFKALLKLIK
ncbi:hydrolase [Shewanella aestuarii]|uniref:Hydrolase n=1 Tax=Shewanella aestuarii TaxID=1028752 RepID=A0A6G9QMS8_9GAMM|nr:hydrolase [Shewanella aestuarii]QIR15375.1 hydrolase [Shewanella aestuarii]